MKKLKQYIPYAILIVILAGFSLILGLTGDVNVSEDFAFKKELPDLVGEWRGRDVFFCQNEQCLKSFSSVELTLSNSCKSCGGPVVQSWSLAEKRLLPPNTGLLRKEYADNSGKVITVTMVITGNEITGIHRPQICLVGQGYQIVNQRTVMVPLSGRKPLAVKILDLVLKRIGKEGTVADLSGTYAYWYAGGARETSDNFTRSFYMFVDRILNGQISRWAYISVVTSGSGMTEKEIVAFVGNLYPEVAAGRKNQGL